MNRALIIVDVQNDFLPGGALGVKGGHKIIPDICSLAETGDYKVIVASRDYHPHDHMSFTEQGGPWPPHCVQGTRGADIDWDILELHPTIVTKGTDADTEAYSAFDGSVDDGSGEEGRWLSSLLDVQYGIECVDMVGLATDYCVKATALAAVKKDFDTRVILHCTRPVDVVTGMQAVAEMAERGVTFMP